MKSMENHNFYGFVFSTISMAISNSKLHQKFLGSSYDFMGTTVSTEAWYSRALALAAGLEFFFGRQTQDSPSWGYLVIRRELQDGAP